MVDNEVPKEQRFNKELGTVEKLVWVLLVTILVVQYGLGLMAEPIPEKFIYALGTAALGLNQIKGR